MGMVRIRFSQSGQGWNAKQYNGRTYMYSWTKCTPKNSKGLLTTEWGLLESPSAVPQSWFRSQSSRVCFLMPRNRYKIASSTKCWALLSLSALLLAIEPSSAEAGPVLPESRPSAVHSFSLEGMGSLSHSPFALADRNPDSPRFVRMSFSEWLTCALAQLTPATPFEPSSSQGTSSGSTSSNGSSQFLVPLLGANRNGVSDAGTRRIVEDNKLLLPPPHSSGIFHPPRIDS